MENCLAVLDPKRYYSRAFREKRWDGIIRMYRGNSFPAGLVDRVVEYITTEGKTVSVIGKDDKFHIDTARFGRDYLPGITLWEHQYEACLTMLNSKRGIIKSPTGSGKTEIIAAVAYYLWEERSWRSLIIVPKKGILTQTVKRIQRYFPDLEVGQFGDGKKIPGTINVATAQTLIGFRPRKHKKRRLDADPILKALVKECEILLIDETHHASASTWYEIAMASKALRRYGLSGTPLKGNEIADMRMIGATGSIIFSVDAKKLIGKGLAAKPRIAMVMSSNASGKELPYEYREIVNPRTGSVRYGKKELPYKEAYDTGIVENEAHNKAVLQATEWLVDNKKQTVIICRRKAQYKLLMGLLDESGLQFRAVWGDTETPERDDAKRLLDEGVIDVLLATTVFDEGEDLNRIEGLVLAEGVKANTNTIQRIGRGMRKKKGGRVNEVWVVDFVPTCHPRLQEHAYKRAQAYESEGYDVQIVTDWPEYGDANVDLTNMLPFNNWNKETD